MVPMADQLTKDALAAGGRTSYGDGGDDIISGYHGHHHASSRARSASSRLGP